MGEDVRGNLGTERTTVLEIYGPKGIREYLNSSFFIHMRGRASNDRHWSLRNVHVYEYQDTRSAYQQTMSIKPDTNGVFNVFEDENVSVKCKHILHTVSCFGYVIETRPKTRLNAVKLREAFPNLKGHLYGDLKAGKDLIQKDGSIIKSSDYVDEVHGGRKVIILGDTSNPMNLKDIGSNADLLIHEATFMGGEEDRARNFGHSTPIMAGEVAKKLGVKNLCLNHFAQQWQDIEINESFIPDAIK